MKILKLKQHLSNSELTTSLKKSKGTKEFSRWQMLYLIQVAKVTDASQIATLQGISKPYVYQIVQGYNKKGVQFIAHKSKGGRKRSITTLDNEVVLLKELEMKAHRGEIKSAVAIKKFIEQKLERRVSEDYLWDLLKRHQWKKKVPRPHHPKADKTKQEEFKKNSPSYWIPLK